MWHRLGSVYCVAIPRGKLAVSPGILLPSAPHCYVLSLGCWNDVYVRKCSLHCLLFYSYSSALARYSFALLLSGCRSVLRPGAMWFIKDPQDQDSHPIRDILDSPTLTQLRKICLSGLMYSSVVVCVVSSIAGLLVVGSKSIMPFRWKSRYGVQSFF